MQFVMDIGLLALFLHSIHTSYIQMSQSRYVKFENCGMSKFSQSLRPTGNNKFLKWTFYLLSFVVYSMLNEGVQSKNWPKFFLCMPTASKQVSI